MMRRKLRSLFRKNRADRELDAELRFHLEKQLELNIAAGMPPAEARNAALRIFGGVEQVKEECREARGVVLVETLVQDVRYGLRMMRRSPAFTAVAVLSLALGIGANTAIFSLINAVMLKMLPVKSPEQLVVMNWTAKQFPDIGHDGNTWGKPPGPFSGSSISYPAFRQFQAQNQVFSDLFGFADLEQTNVVVDGHADIARGHLVSGNFFSGLGVQAIVGRTFTDADDQPAADAAAVISFRYWDRRFGRDASVIGKAIAVNGVPFVIAGVTPREFFGLAPGEYPDIWVPLSMQPRVVPQWGGKAQSLLGVPGEWWVQPWGRLKPGTSRQQASAALSVALRQRMTADLAPPPEQIAWIELRPGGKGLDDVRTDYSEPLMILMCIVGLVLLIACANVANLLLARSTARRRETAVRMALGAGRQRLIRLLLTESVMLAFLGGALGLALAFRGGALLLWLVSSPERPFALEVHSDAHILMFCATVSLVTGILFGLAPALRATRLDVSPVLKSGLGAWSGPSRWMLGKALVAGQVALSLLILIGASMFVRSLQKLNSIDVGFNRENLLLFGIDGSLSGYKDERLGSLYQRIQQSLRAIPGVRSATLARHGLIGDGSSTTGIEIPGYQTRPGERLVVYKNSVGPDFFETMGIPILLGRGLTDRDNQTGPKVVVINEALARQYFPNQLPVGKRITWHEKNVEIVGIARNAKYHDLRQEDPPTVYEPYLQFGGGRVVFAVRTAGDPVSIIRDVRRAVATVDRNLPLYYLRTQVQQIDSALTQERLFADLTSCFGGLALLLASIGLYGVMSYTVARRTGEIGIRIALGAAKSDIARMVLREVLVLIAAGLSIGLPVALLSTRLISKQLYGLSPSDPGSIAVALGVLALVAGLAGYLPARRAARIDPMAALRQE